MLWANLLEKDPDAGKDWGQEKGTTEDEVVRWHHWLNRREFKQSHIREILFMGSQKFDHVLATEQQLKI